MADVSANLLYYYKFDRNDISGNKLKNHATNNYDATLSSSSAVSNRNYYIGISSLDCQYGTMSVPLTLGASGFSFSFWLSATHNQNNFYFNSNFINLSHYNNILRIYGALDFIMSNNGNSSTWMHIIITWSTANVITFYLNGKYNNAASNLTYPTVTNVVFSIYGGTYFFDDFRIYNYVISSQQDVNYLYYYPNYKSYINNLSNASLLSKFRSNFYDRNQSNIIFGYEPRNITPGTILLISGKSGVTTRNFGNYANSVTYSSISQAIFNSQYSLLYVIDNISGTISIINMQTGTINVVTTMDASSNAVENRYNLNVGIKSLAFDVSQNYFYLINGSYIQQMDYTTNMFIKNINSNALTSPQFCIIDSSNVLYISHATGIDKINLFAALPITTTNAITTATQISHMAISSMYPGKLFAVDGVSGKIYIITISTNAYFALTLPGAVNTSLCFDTLGNLYVSTNTRKIFLIPVRVFSQYSVDTTLARTGNYAGIYDYLDYAGTSGTGSTGDGGLAIGATFNTISHIMMDAGNNMYISDSSNCTIRKVINKIRNTNYLNQITDEMGISSLYDISTLYSPRYNINANAATNFYVGTNSSGIDADIEATNFNWIDNSGLVLYYKFNTSGVNGVNIANYATGYPVFDASMSTSGLVNSTDFVLDNVALNLNGGFVTINNSTLLAGINSTSIFNQGLSFAYWVRSNNTGNYGKMFEFGNQASATYSINTYILNNELYCGVNINGVYYYYDTNYSINNNIWYHICWTLTYSNTNTSTYNVYVNGTIIYGITTGVYPSSAVTYPLCYIGKSTFPSDASFNGVIDDFRMYTRVITNSEVSKLSNMGYKNETLIDLTTVGAVPTLPTTTNSNTVFYITDAIPIKTGYYTATGSNIRVGSGGIVESAANAFDNTATITRTTQVYATNGSHTGTTTTMVEGTSFRGEWFQIQLPYLLKLTSYSLSNTTLDIYRLLGSNDGTTWYFIDRYDRVTEVVGNVTVTLSSYLDTTTQTWAYQRLNQSYYSYFRILFSTATSLNSQRAQIGEFKLYGVGKYLQNNPTNNTFNLSIFDALPIMTNDTTVISNYVPSILNGTYIMSASSFLGNNSGYSPGKAFNGIITDFWNSDALYTTSGVYTGTVTTNTNIGTLSGEWIQIDMPYSLSLTGYSMLPRSSLLQFPKNWYLVGSNDGSNWYTIDVRSAITPTNAYLNYGNSYGNQNYYSKFRIVVISHGGNTSTSGTVINEIEFSGIGKQLEYYENIYEFPSYNAVPPLSTASTTISGVMPFLLNGIYQASSSSEYSIDYSGVKAFVYNNNFWNSTFWNSGGAYNGSGTFIGTTVTSVRAPNLINVYGEWVQVKLPYALSITEYSMTPRSDFYKYQFPKSWYLVGSNDGTTWDAIDYQNYSTIVNQVYFSGNSYRNENYYSYLRIIVLNITSSGVVNGTAITTIRMQGRGRNL